MITAAGVRRDDQTPSGPFFRSSVSKIKSGGPQLNKSKSSTLQISLLGNNRPWRLNTRHPCS